MISPTITQSGQPTPSTLQKSELTPTLTIKQSTVTSPLTTPSTPRSASSAPSIESKTPTMATHRDSIDSNTEEARRKKVCLIRFIELITPTILARGEAQTPPVASRAEKGSRLESNGRDLFFFLSTQPSFPRSTNTPKHSTLYHACSESNDRSDETN